MSRCMGCDGTGIAHDERTGCRHYDMSACSGKCPRCEKCGGTGKDAGAHRCGNPSCPRASEEREAALRAELARVTAERDALRGALEVELERACDTTTRYTLERVLATTGGDR